MKRTLHLLLFLAGILFAYNGAYAQERKEFVANGYLETSDLSNSSVNIKNEGSQIRRTRSLMLAMLSLKAILLLNLPMLK